MIKRIFKKEFFLSICCKQNKWHSHGVFLHTLKVVYYTFKNQQYKMLASAFLHDIGKPFVVYQDDEDKITGEYSFTNHEEVSYQIVKNWIFLSPYSKNLIRYHYLIRGMKNAKTKNQMGKYRRLKRIYDRLDGDFIKDLEIFLKFDDLGK